MSGRSALVYDDGLNRYNFGPGHPMAPIRVDLTMRLARSLGVLDNPDLRLVAGPTATDDELLAGPHRAATSRPSSGSATIPTRATWRMGSAPRTTRSSRGCTTRRRTSSGATLEAARLVWRGEVLHAVNVSGGLHHAMADSASGFCIYNDPAIAIAWLLANGRRTDRVRRHRRASRRRRPGGVLRRPPGPDDQPARVAPDAVPRYRVRATRPGAPRRRAAQ